MRNILTKKIPTHVAMILDGNSRWARLKEVRQSDGYWFGVNAALDIAYYCRELNIQYLTLYLYSLENNTRPASDINSLIKAVKNFFNHNKTQIADRGIRIRVIGSESFLKRYHQMISTIVNFTALGRNLTVTLAVYYSGKAEILEALQNAAHDILYGRLNQSNLTDVLVSTYLKSGFTPNPDLLIRTSGEIRLSNFLLWQLAYSELYISPVLWPDFKRDNLDSALLSYIERRRRFGSN